MTPTETKQAEEPKKKKERDPNNHNLPKNLQKALQFLVDKYEKEDSWVRKQQLKLWKKNEEFWHGIQFVFWSESRQDWLSPTMYRWFNEDEGREGAEGPFYDFVINIYRAHGEAIISALSSQVPAVRFPPDDAEDSDDIITSKTYAKIAELIQRHNQVKVLQLNSWFALWNTGILAWYHAPKADKAFGMTQVENYKEVLVCPNCDYEEPVDDEENIEMPELQNCPKCGSPMKATQHLDSTQESPKTRVIIDQFNGLHVKVPYWARTQGDFSYLIKALDQPKPFLKFIFPHIADEIGNDEEDAQQWERMARTPSTFTSFSRADDNQDLSTFRQCWLRPWSYEGLPKDQEAEKKALYKRFPDGAYVGFVGRTYAESRNEDLDDYWTICKTGLSTYIHADAMAQPIVPLQEGRNVLFNLTLETIEQGIGSQFADSRVLNFDVYSKHEARPGYIYPVRPREGRPVSDSFFEAGRATLSREVGELWQQIDKDAQFTTGSFPSLYGGPADGKSRTLGEYQESRTQALQRLSIAWALFVIAWAKLMEKCVHLFVDNMIDDERFVVPDQTNKDSYINVWIRKAELSGHVGEVEPEGADSFPLSTPQKQSFFFKLLEMNNQFVNAALFATPNRRIIADLVSFPELEIPGEDQVIKQATEISDIIKGQNVQVDPLIDDNAIHIEMLRYYLAGEKGIDLKRTNPQAYQQVLQHLQQHMQAEEQRTKAESDKMAQQYVRTKAESEVMKHAVKATGEAMSQGAVNGTPAPGGTPPPPQGGMPQ